MRTWSISFKYSIVSQRGQINHLNICDMKFYFIDSIHYMFKSPKFKKPTYQN